MNNQQIMQHTMKALDGSGHEHKPLWSEATTREQDEFVYPYLDQLGSAECSLLSEQAQRAYNNVVMRHAINNKVKTGFEFV